MTVKLAAHLLFELSRAGQLLDSFLHCTGDTAVRRVSYMTAFKKQVIGPKQARALEVSESRGIPDNDFSVDIKVHTPEVGQARCLMLLSWLLPVPAHCIPGLSTPSLSTADKQCTCAACVSPQTCGTVPARNLDQICVTWILYILSMPPACNTAVTAISFVRMLPRCHTGTASIPICSGTV